MSVRRPLDTGSELLAEFDHGGRVVEYLIAALPRRLWRAAPPAGRPIAAIVAHIQSVRRTFAKMGGAPPFIALDRARSTQSEARRALRESRAALTDLFSRALARGDARVKGMPRRVVSMMVYLIQHDAHHRGQISMLARALGHRLSGDDVMRIWGWKKLP
ncbi:MAG: DinB family protein [Vicinamibacteria bacterium]|nr:DinB family protein [Vicinamibacteria bacterium]